MILSRRRKDRAEIREGKTRKGTRGLILPYLDLEFARFDDVLVIPRRSPRRPSSTSFANADLRKCPVPVPVGLAQFEKDARDRLTIRQGGYDKRSRAKRGHEANERRRRRRRGGKQFQTPGNEHYNAILRGMK